MTLAKLNYVYDTLTSHYGVQLVQGTVTGINTDAKTVTLSGGASYSYGRLVLAPGLEFDLLPGMSSLSQYDQLIPHAWQAGPQTQLLRNQLVGMTNGKEVVITIPKAPYRCPPGPYERACVVADWLAKNKPASKVVVLDANDDILVERDNFHAAFNGVHGYFVDYRPRCQDLYIESVTNRTVSYKDANVVKRTLTAGVLNPIPPQRAPQLLADTGLYNPVAGERSAPVNVLSYESTRKPSVHVIGDASATSMPKAGHIGNQQAKTCADAILRSLQNKPLDAAPVTNSACYTPITATTATWLSAVYQYDGVSKMVIPGQHNNGTAISAAEATTENYEDMQVWFKTLMADTFT
jgi:NADPH-dependent 2,4-dienoyl-CoA reductase/sulfur reductase-like enzyme